MRAAENRADDIEAVKSQYRTIIATAPISAIVAGSEWYPRVQDMAHELARAFDVSLESAASVLAAFSPLTPWARNVFLATEFFHGRATPTLPTSIAAAERSLTMGFAAFGKDATKTHAFARNIAGDLDGFVTIDSHMVKASGIGGPAKVNNDAEYMLLSQAVIEVAEEFALQPAVAQAIIWVAVRGSAV